MKLELVGGPQDGETRNVPDDMDTIWTTAEVPPLDLCEKLLVLFSAYRRRKGEDGASDRMVYIGDRWI